MRGYFDRDLGVETMSRHGARHDVEGYFDLGGVELSKAECFALDSLGLLIFQAAHRLADTGELAKTVHGLNHEQVEILRLEAVQIAAQVVMADARDLLPIHLEDSNVVLTWELKSHLKHARLTGS
jgi:hypothetical protein